MRKFIYIWIIVLFFVACKKGDMKTIEVEKVWEDPELVLKELKESLTSHKSGWEYTITYGPNQSISYGYLGFANAESADFISDYSANFSTFDKTAYNLLVVQTNPSLRFSQNSRFANFAADVRLIDTLFTYKGIRGDTVLMEGEYRGSIMKLTKCSPEKLQKLKANSINGDMEKIKKLADMPMFYFKYQQDGKSVGFDVDTASKSMTFISGTENIPVYLTSKYYFNGNGVSLERPIELDGLKIHHMEDLQLQAMEMLIKGNIKISNEKAPKVIDRRVLREFIGLPTSNLWYISMDGFGERKKPDLAGLNKIANYTNFNLAPYYAFNEEFQVHFWFATINLQGESPGSAFGPYASATPEGMLKFLPFLETPASPMPDVVEAMKITGEYLFNSVGHYVQRYKLGYALVDARDAKTWAYFINAD